MSLLGTATPVSDVSGSRSTPATDTGGVYVATNITAGTGIVSNNPITLAAAATAPSMVIYNGNSGATAPGNNAPVNIYPLYLKLIETAASTGGTQLNFQWHLDVINRFASAGVAGGTLVAANCNSGSTAKSNAVINFGAIVSPAAQSDKLVSGNLRCRVGLIDILGDQLQFNWGGPTLSPPTAFLTTATIGNFQFGLQSMAIAPGQSLVLTIWQPTTFTTGVTYELEFGYIER
jgi:hypothetical protein